MAYPTTSYSLSLWAAACLLCWLCSLTVVAAESSSSASAKWHDLVKSAAPVATTDETVLKAALYAVERIEQTYAKVMGSPRYAAHVSAEPYFVLESIQKAALRMPGAKYFMELVLTNPMVTSNMGSVPYMTDRLRSSPELGALFARWRSERMQETARLANGMEPLTAGLLQPIARHQHGPADQLPRQLRAFFMGLDPVQDANQLELLGETPEVHRVVVAVDPVDGEFDVQFHQLVKPTLESTGAHHASSIISNEGDHLLL